LRNHKPEEYIREISRATRPTTPKNSDNLVECVNDTVHRLYNIVERFYNVVEQFYKVVEEFYNVVERFYNVVE